MGAGISGIAAARLAHRLGHRAILIDENSNEKLSALAEVLDKEGIECRFGSCPAKDEFSDVECVIVSPGIPLDSPMERLAESFGVPVLGELSFGAMHCKSKIVAVTGTNGKTTTVELLTSCLNAAGHSAVSGGNIGLPLSAIAVESPDKFEWIVAEVSSFQLEHPQGFAPDGAILLNVTPDHLSRHGTMEEYRRIKMSIFDCVKDGGFACVQSDLSPHLSAENAARLTTTSFSAHDEQTDFSCRDGLLHGVIATEKIHLRGKHNFENALAVLSCCHSIGIPTEKVADAIAEFTPDDHRLQEVGCRSGVRFVNDSKATNVDALLKALQTIGAENHIPQKNILLIAGGIDKGCDLSGVKNELSVYVKVVFAIGACRARLAHTWQDVVQVNECASLEEAVNMAKAAASAGDIVLLSPGCASQDMFSDYKERGNRFVQFALQSN